MQKGGDSYEQVNTRFLATVLSIKKPSYWFYPHFWANMSFWDLKLAKSTQKWGPANLGFKLQKFLKVKKKIFFVIFNKVVFGFEHLFFPHINRILSHTAFFLTYFCFFCTFFLHFYEISRKTDDSRKTQGKQTNNEKII